MAAPRIGAAMLVPPLIGPVFDSRPVSPAADEPAPVVLPDAPVVLVVPLIPVPPLVPGSEPRSPGSGDGTLAPIGVPRLPTPPESDDVDGNSPPPDPI